MTPRVGNILFSGPMVRALLDGRKVQTRRLAWKPAGGAESDKRISTGNYPPDGWRWINGVLHKATSWRKMHRRFEAAGYRELLYVREGFAAINGPQRAAYRADGDNPDEWKWTPSIHMPRWASRLTLEVTGTKLERLQDISENAAWQEGVDCLPMGLFRDYLQAPDIGIDSARGSFQSLWESLHGPDSWNANPEVVALTFRVHRCNVDEVRP